LGPRGVKVRVCTNVEWRPSSLSSARSWKGSGAAGDGSTTGEGHGEGEGGGAWAVAADAVSAMTAAGAAARNASMPRTFARF
jgi:hypothetical protein